MENKANTYIIAEIGINHNGSLDNCYRLIDAAKNAGCDCVKFQIFKARQLYPRSAGKLNWENKEKKYSYDIFSAVKNFELPAKWVGNLISYCRIKKIDFLSSVFDKEGAAYLMRKRVRAIKLASSVVTNLPLIDYCSRFKVPLIMSTGGATLGEIEEAREMVNSCHNMLSLLHCSLKYPAKLGECNLGVIKTMRYAFPGNCIGYSDHTREVSRAAVQAVYLGAKIIEKHITLDKEMEGPDHFFALNPQELKQMVADIRKAENSFRNGSFKINKILYGNTEKITYPHEKYLRDFIFMKLFAKRDIKRGEVIRPGDILILRPGKKKHGLDPKFLWLFEDYRITANRDIPIEGPINWDIIF